MYHSSSIAELTIGMKEESSTDSGPFFFFGKRFRIQAIVMPGGPISINMFLRSSQLK